MTAEITGRHADIDRSHRRRSSSAPVDQDGYDVHIHLRAGTPRDWTFVAKHSGRFEFELDGKVHGAHEALSVILVLPR